MIKQVLGAGAALMSLWFGVATAADWSAKVEPELLRAATQQPENDFIIQLADQADLSAAAGAATRIDKGRVVVQALQAAAARSQPALRSMMQARGLPQQAFWIANAISTRGTRADIEALARRSDVKSLHLLKNDLVPSALPVESRQSKAEGEGVVPGVALVGAPAVWALGFRGQGVVVGDHDIGVQWDHPALKEKYRGWNGSEADHRYNWHNAFAADPFCSDLSVPCDSNGHGTHTTGTMVGDDGEGNQIGMAPGAKWMACRSLLDPIVGLGTVPTYLECMQWTLAPYPTGEPEAADPAQAPDVVNNSWGCVEACAPPVLQTTNQAIKAAGIVQVVSAGNDGSQCSTLAFPLAVYESSFTVGATNIEDGMAGFSSRGPVLSDASLRVKPNVVAPGVGTLSSLDNGGYGTLSGTSMAGPHVAGLVALILSAEPRLKGRVDEVRTLIERTALKIATTQVCGGTGQDDIPNNIFGYGRIDALAAVLARPQLQLAATTTGTTDLVYSVTVSQPPESKLDATSVQLRITLPPGVTPKQDGTPLSYQRATLAPGESWTTELQLKTSTPGPQTIVSVAEADQVSAVASAVSKSGAAGRSGRFGGTLGLGLLLALGSSLLLRRRIF